MLKEAERFHLPVGESRKLEKLVYSNPEDHLFRLAPVDNEALWVNPNFPHLPFDLEVGRPSSLGLFAYGFYGSQKEPMQKELYGEYWPGHFRSGLLGRVFISDKDGQIYRDIDLKGIGSFSYYMEGLGLKRREGYEGLFDSENAFHGAQMAEKLHAAGIRTSRTLGIIKLKEIIFNGDKIDIDRFKRGEKIREEFEPVVEARAFATKLRIMNIGNYFINSDQKQIMFEDAKKIVEQETGFTFETNEQYLLWFAMTLGQNVALMHNIGLYHNYLSTHNITLDCRIVDTDSVGEIDNQDQVQHDFDEASRSLNSLGQHHYGFGHYDYIANISPLGSLFSAYYFSTRRDVNSDQNPHPLPLE